MEDFDSDLEDFKENFIVHEEKKSKKRSFETMQEESETPTDTKQTSYDPDAAEQGIELQRAKIRKLESELAAMSKMHKLEEELTEMNNLDSFLNQSESENESDGDGDEDSDLEKDSESDNESENEQDDDEEDEVANLVVDGKFTREETVDFEILDIHQGYYHHIKNMLGATGWNQNKLHVGLLSDTIVAQEEIGCAISVGKSIMGFMTLLSFRKYFEHLSLAHIRKFLDKHCKNHGNTADRQKKRPKWERKKIGEVKNTEHRKIFRGYFEKKRIGLLLQERPVNTPAELIPHLYRTILDDYEYATTFGKAAHLSKEECAGFKVDYILMVVRLRWVPLNLFIENIKTKKGKRRRRGNAEEQQEQIENPMQAPSDPILTKLGAGTRKNEKLVYEHHEGSILMQKAEFQFTVGRDHVGQLWSVIIISMDAFKQAVKEMSVFSESKSSSSK